MPNFKIEETVQHLKDELSEKNHTRTRTVVAINSFDSDSDDRSTDSEEVSGISQDALKVVLLEQIVMAENTEKSAFLKELFKSVKDRLSSLTCTEYLFKKRKLAGYSEYTCWMVTIEASGEVELVDLNALNLAIDEFSDTFKDKSNGR